MAVLLSIVLLLAFEVGGTAIVAFLGIPVPGSVVGMVLFLFALMTWHGLHTRMLPVVNVILAHFALLLVPAGVGIVEGWPRLAADWLPITAAIVISSILAMAVTGLVTRAVMHLGASRETGRDA